MKVEIFFPESVAESMIYNLPTNLSIPLSNLFELVKKGFVEDEGGTIYDYIRRSKKIVEKSFDDGDISEHDYDVVNDDFLNTLLVICRFRNN